MNPKRRRVLKILGGTAVAGAGLLAGAGMAADYHIVRVVRRRLPMLKLDDAGVHAFARAYMVEKLNKHPSWKRIKTRVSEAFMRRPVFKFENSTDRRTNRERSEDDIATQFLLSSDFFWNGANPDNVVRYRGLYLPYQACGNPFARPAPGLSNGV